MANCEVTDVEIASPDWCVDISGESGRKSNPIPPGPFSVYTRLLRNRSGNIINRIFSARRPKSKQPHIGESSATVSNSNCISVGIQTVQGDEEDEDCDQLISDQFYDANVETLQEKAFEEVYLDAFEQPTDLKNGLDEIKLDSGGYSDVGESDIEVEYDTSSDEEAIFTTNKPDSEIPKLSPIINSLFPEIPPFIRFVKDDEAVIPFPISVLKKLIWRNSQITPNVLKRALERSHFKLTNRPNADWIGYFGRHIPSIQFRQLKDYQKLNHIPGSFELGRKDQLTKNLSKLRYRICGEAYNFYPTTFLLPREYSRLKTAFRLSFTNNKKRANSTWIVKPPASSRGRGIYLANKLADFPRIKKVVVQKYITDPYLINGNKFDLRIYVYVTSVDPLRIYIHRNGLVRFASRKYSISQTEVGNKFVHLTNFSINKKNVNYKAEGESFENFSHKWTLDELWVYLKARGHDIEKLWDDIKSIAFKTIATATLKMASMVAQHVRCRESIHEVFGFDILLDSKLRPWLLEVNVSPSLHTSSKIDNDIKSEVIVDLLNLAGFRLPPKEETENIRSAQSSGRGFYETRPSKLTYRPSTGMETRVIEDQNLPFHKVDQLRYTLTDAEKAKHRFYSTRAQFPSDMKTIMDEPTTDDVLMLTTTVNEWYRASLGRFERIYPQRSPEDAKMLNLIYKECDRLTKSRGNFRYYDALIFQFLQRFGINENSPIEGRNSCVNYSRQFGGQDLHILSRILGISIKGLMFVAKLSERRLSTDLAQSDLCRPSPFRKPSRPEGTKRFSKSTERSSSLSNSFREPSRSHSIETYKVIRRPPSKHSSYRRNSTNSTYSKSDTPQRGHVKNSRPRSTISNVKEFSLDQRRLFQGK